MSRLYSFLRKNNHHQEIVVVSGLPRSGTSLMMKMLEAGGIQSLTDNQRKADEDNPKGYYEFERVKKLKDGDYEWLSHAEGKVVKIISALLPHLPVTHTYKVIFMERKIAEVLASQRQMLVNRGEQTDKVSDDELARLFQDHLTQVMSWMEKQSYIHHIKVNYNDIIENPMPQTDKINQFLGGGLDVRKMIEVVDPNLYRQRV